MANPAVYGEFSGGPLRMPDRADGGLRFGRRRHEDPLRRCLTWDG